LASGNFAGTLALAPASDPAKPVGSYTITASGLTSTNYAITYVPGTWTVGAKVLTITAKNQTKTYGEPLVLGTSQFTASGLVGSDSVDSVTLTSAGASATATVAGGPYPITPSAAVGTGLANYTISYVDGSLTVSKAALTVTADNRIKTYGSELDLGTGAFTADGLVNSDTVTGVRLASPGAAADASVAGNPYPITASAAVGTGLGNYAITYVSGVLTVNAKALTIGADGVSTTYGQTPSFSVTVTGLVAGDNLSSGNFGGTLAFAPTADPAKPVGSYTITPSGLTSTNYAITYAPGTWTVNPKALTIKANDVSTT
jgi:hypothetical protein